MNREDGPNSKWTKTVDVRQLGNLPSSPELQNKIAEITQTFPTPRLLTDDGNQDVADLHAREDLLLNNYTWIDQSKGTVRIPIEQAMQLIAQRGLPVAPAVNTQAPMTGDIADRDRAADQWVCAHQLRAGTGGAGCRQAAGRAEIIVKLGSTIRKHWSDTAVALVGAIVLSLGSPLLAAQVSSYGDKEAGPTNDRPPTLLNGVGIDQHLNTQLPLNLDFH